MLRRFLCISLLVFQAIWLNVIVPGHTRGVVALPGCAACETTHRETAKAADCCVATHSKNPAHPPGRDPASNCAICYFAATVSAPPVLDLTPPKLGLAEILKPPAPRSADSVRIAVIRRDRAPPMGV